MSSLLTRSGPTQTWIPSRLQSCLDQIKCRWNGSYKSYPMFLKNLENVMIGLPIELIVLIAKFLTEAERVLLSLASLRLRAILNEYFDLVLRDGDQRLDFLLLLERDLPNYLTCRPCAAMYKWRRQKRSHYVCPRKEHEQHGEEFIHCHNNHKAAVVSQGIIDLILRAYHKGPKHGLDASILDHDCSDSRMHNGKTIRIQDHFEGRVIDDQFFLARSFTFVQNFSQFQELPHSGFRLLVCRHHFATLTWCKLSQETSWDPQNPFDFQTKKCGYCSTDYRLRLLPMTGDNRMRLMVFVWQNYGKCGPDQHEVSSIFTTSEISESVLTARNLERDFVTGKYSRKVGGFGMHGRCCGRR